MSSSFLQLVLDIIVFTIVHYYIIFPLMTRGLGFITGVSNTETTSSTTTVFDKLRGFIQAEEEQQNPTTTTAPFTTTITTEDTECEKCNILLEPHQPSITRTACGCTWCITCIEDCFIAVDTNMDVPLKGLSKSCEGARGVTMRELVPFVRGQLSGKVRRYVDTMGEVEIGKNDWMLDCDGEE